MAMGYTVRPCHKVKRKSKRKERKEGKGNVIFPDKIVQTQLEAFSKDIKDEDPYCNPAMDELWSAVEDYLCVWETWSPKGGERHGKQ